MSDLEQDVRNGLEAAQIIESPIYQAAFNAIEKELINSWQTTSVKQGDDREKLYLMIRLLSRLKTELESVMTSGQLSRKRIQELQEQGRLSHITNFLRG